MCFADGCHDISILLNIGNGTSENCVNEVVTGLETQTGLQTKKRKHAPTRKIINSRQEQHR